MLEVIDDFVKGKISIDACTYALSALDLGKQYVLKTNKAVEKLGLYKEHYLCNAEKEYYRTSKISSNKKRYESIKNFRSKYRNGKYIEELL